MLMRTDPFRDFDRLTRQVLGTSVRPSVMPMDAWKDDGHLVMEFDLPGITPDSIDLDVERNVLRVSAERGQLSGERELIAEERPRGIFSRELMLSDNLDTEKIEADYAGGVLTVRVPVAENAKPRKIAVNQGSERDYQAISA